MIVTKTVTSAACAAGLLLTIAAVGCRTELAPGMSQHEAWKELRNRRGEQFLKAHPVGTLHPDQPAPEECEYMETVTAGPGFGVAGEQHNVLKVAALMGATHVQWQDQETAYLYRCADREPESLPGD